MKSYYKISEISALYNICPDSLRYYEEKGLLAPRRDENGYRIYGVQDFWRLNVIKDLRQLGFSTERIKDYLDERTVQTTLALLAEEEALISEQMAKLEAQLGNIRRRSADLTALESVPLGEIHLQKLPKRYCCRIQEHVSLDGEVDFLIKRLQKEHENTLYIIGNNRIGALLDEEQWPKGVYNMYSAVFIIDDTAADGDSLGRRVVFERLLPRRVRADGRVSAQAFAIRSGTGLGIGWPAPLGDLPHRYPRDQPAGRIFD